MDKNEIDYLSLFWNSSKPIELPNRLKKLKELYFGQNFELWSLTEDVIVTDIIFLDRNGNFRKFSLGKEDLPL